MTNKNSADDQQIMHEIRDVHDTRRGQQRALSNGVYCYTDELSAAMKSVRPVFLRYMGTANDPAQRDDTTEDILLEKYQLHRKNQEYESISCCFPANCSAIFATYRPWYRAPASSFSDGNRSPEPPAMVDAP